MEIDPTLSRPRPAPSSSIDQAYFRCYCFLTKTSCVALVFFIKDHVVVFVLNVVVVIVEDIVVDSPPKSFHPI